MSTSSSELKKRARQSLKGRYGLCTGAQFLSGAVLIVITTVYILSLFSLGLMKEPFSFGGYGTFAGNMLLRAILYLFFLMIFSVYSLIIPGVLKIYLNLSTGHGAGLSDLLFAFQNKPHKFIGLYLLNTFIGFIWSIPYFVVLAVARITEFIPVMVVLLVLTYLFWIIGSIFTMLYLSQSMYILIESADQGLWKCLKESVHMMKGNKGRLFYIHISFFGMIILGYCSLGIGFLWIFPYIYSVLTEFYLDLREKNSHSFDRNREEEFSQTTWENQW